MLSPQRVDKLSTGWQTLKKEVLFCESGRVGVQRYGRDTIRKKQAIARKIRCFPCNSFLFFSFIQISGFCFTHFSLALERLFRQSAGRAKCSPP